MPKRAPPVPPPSRQSLEAEIRRLKDELYMTQYALMERAPDAVTHEALTAQHFVSTFKDFAAWEQWACARFLRKAGESAVTVPELKQRRAYCPLCGGGSSAPYAEGFSLPVGLERHLLGTHGSRVCAVFGAAKYQARERALERQHGEAPQLRVLNEQVPPWRRPEPSEPPEPEPPTATIFPFQRMPG
jgi:hypothetical protein